MENQTRNKLPQREKKEMTDQQRSLLHKLLPRIFKLKLIHIPESNESQVIVQPNRSVLGFKTNCYKTNQKYLSNFISQTEFERVVFKGILCINSANKVIQEEVLENKKRDHTDNFYQASMFLKMSFLMTAIGIIFMAIIVYGDFPAEFQSVLQYIAIGLICASALSAIVVVAFIQKTKFVPSNFEEKVWNKLFELVSTETQALAADGRSFLTWGVGQQFFWLSLSISYLHMPKDYVRPKSQ